MTTLVSESRGGHGLADAALPPAGRGQVRPDLARLAQELYTLPPGRSQAPELLSFAEASRHLAHDVTLNIVGGCLYAPLAVTRSFYGIVAAALTPDADHPQACRANIISGGSLSRLAHDRSAIRPSVPELGAYLERLCPHARCLAVFPGRSLQKLPDGALLICTDQVGGQSFEIAAHPLQSLAFAAPGKEGYFWNPEADARFALNRATAVSASVSLFYDGGIGTEYELCMLAEASKHDPRQQIILMLGGNPRRTTDRYARDAAFLDAHPNVHVIESSASALKGLLIEFGVLR